MRMVEVPTMEIWRVEDLNGIGPYQVEGDNLLDHLRNIKGFNIKDYIKDRPLLKISEIIDKHNIDYKFIIFGFKNENQLYRWFSYSNEYEYFNKYGFYISKYESPIVIEYPNQIISDKRYLKLIERKELYG